MHVWNVIATVREQDFAKACKILETFGRVRRTHYYNVLTLDVPSLDNFVDDLAAHVAAHPDDLEAIGRVAPAQRLFIFRSPEEFEERARKIAEEWAPELAGKSFHVRMHRRGFKGQLSSQQEEQFLDYVILEATEAAGARARVTFEDPDAIIALETLDDQGGLSLWTRADLRRLTFLRLD
ncbi:MAG: THUMP domain-containing protein [Alphaproteobacteria bacterium]|nr:THUMP domain-containing protein [Alphaproteobacteria bacterium]